MPNVLRTCTPNGDWRSFKFTCEETAGLLGVNAAWAAGTAWLYLINHTVGALFQDVDFGEEGVLHYHAEKIDVAKMTESTDIFLPGMRVYFDPTTRLVTPEFQTEYLWIGIATEPAGAADTIVEIDLKGERAEVEAGL